MYKKWAMWMARWTAIFAALTCAFLLGQKTAEDRHRDGLFDAIDRASETQYAILDLSVRTLHYVNPNHSKNNPFCPECFELSQRLKSHKEVAK